LTITPELFLAILSMDAYNRGYGAGIKDGGGADRDGLGDGIGTRIGTATVSNRSSSLLNSPEFAAGFYALAYTLDTDQTVISYRGTDGLTLGSSPISGGSDIFNGWIQGAGTPTDQSRLALDFYNDVTNGGLPTADTAPNTIVTGHSLGGGLAGLVSTLTGVKGVGFDHMPIAIVAQVQQMIWQEVINQGRLQDDPDYDYVTRQPASVGCVVPRSICAASPPINHANP
jgi:hypothetical protein